MDLIQITQYLDNEINSNGTRSITGQKLNFILKEIANLVQNSGDSAYQVAVDNGFVGNEAAWLLSLIGKDAYEIAVDNGFVGDVNAWLASLQASIPTGIITMWSGSIGSIPSGWVLCDGTSGTPNLSGRFIVGYNSGDVDYNTIGNTGGAKTTSLDMTNIPEHSHSLPRSAAGGGESGGAATAYKNDAITTTSSASVSNITQSNTGSNPVTAIDRRAPYYTLAYIMKL